MLTWYIEPAMFVAGTAWPLGEPTWYSCSILYGSAVACYDEMIVCRFCGGVTTFVDGKYRCPYCLPEDEKCR